MGRLIGRFRRLAIMAATLAAAGLPAAASAAGAAGQPPPRFNPPRQYYLALGDSLAFGFHENQFRTELLTGTYDPATFNDGYDQDLAGMLRALLPPGLARSFTEVNYGCPGETTSSMVGATQACPYFYVKGTYLPGTTLALHDNYPDSDTQLQAAIAFLLSHPGQVNPITLDIGGNDILNLIGPCSGNPSCIAAALPTAIATMQANLDLILTQLQNAAPNAEILVMNVPDPYAVTAVYGSFAAGSIQLFGAFDEGLDAVVSAHRDRLVDAYSAALQLATTDPAEFCAEVPAGCPPPFGDVHPTAAGYMTLATEFWDASGYASFRGH